jgi:hypothetical protein
MDGTVHDHGEGAPCDGLIYASTALFPPPDVLLDIVRTAERENARHGLSGMLCYSQRRYVQLLEGPAPALAGLRRNLSRDLRHRMLWTVRLVPGPRRIPARLPMGYASEAQVRHWGGPLPEEGSDICPDAAAAAHLATEIGALARRIYPRACRVKAAG